MWASPNATKLPRLSRDGLGFFTHQAPKRCGTVKPGWYRYVGHQPLGEDLQESSEHLVAKIGFPDVPDSPPDTVVVLNPAPKTVVSASHYSYHRIG